MILTITTRKTKFRFERIKTRALKVPHVTFHDFSPSRAHLVLTKLGIVHFLCLGGLWGQIRIGRTLPWARKVELCLVDTLRDDVLITKAFREVGLSATYLHAAGIYRIQEHEVGEDAPKVEVVVFEEDTVVRNASEKSSTIN